MIITAITTRNLTVLSKLKDCLKIAKFTCRTNPLGLTELLFGKHAMQEDGVDTYSDKIFRLSEMSAA